MKTYVKFTAALLFFTLLVSLSAFSGESKAKVGASRPTLSTPELGVAERISRTRGTFGIGFVLGEPSGISWKYWLGTNRAVDGAFGYSFGDDYRLSVNYLIHEDAFDGVDFPLYYGIGGAISGNRGYITRSKEGNFALGVRGVIGVSYLFKRAPLDAFLEVAPIVFIAPPVGLSIDFCFGLRVYP